MLLSPHEVIEPELPTLDDLDAWFTGYANPQLKEHARNFAMGHEVKLKLNAVLFKSFWIDIQNRFDEQGWHCHLSTLVGIGSESEITIYVQARRKQREAPEATAWAAFQQGYKDAMMNEKPKRSLAHKLYSTKNVFIAAFMGLCVIAMIAREVEAERNLYVMLSMVIAGLFIGWLVRGYVKNGT